MPIPDDALELLRSRSGLSIDDEGRFLHLGEPITHARTLEVLWRSLERTRDGRWLARIGRESGYVTVAETPWVVRSVEGVGGAGDLVLVLSDGTREPLDPSALRVGGDEVLRCTVKGDQPARFGRAAQIALGSALEEDPRGSGDFVLVARGRRWTVRRAQ